MTTKQERIDALADKVLAVVEAYVSRSLVPLREELAQARAETGYLEMKVEELQPKLAEAEQRIAALEAKFADSENKRLRIA